MCEHLFLFRSNVAQVNTAALKSRLYDGLVYLEDLEEEVRQDVKMSMRTRK